MTSTYWCVWCGKRLEGEPVIDDNGEVVGWVFEHDDVDHEPAAAFDEEERPQ